MLRIKAQCSVALFQQARAFEFAISLLQPRLAAPFAAVLGNDQRAGAEQPSSGPAQQPQRSRILLGRIVGRIERDQIEGLR